LIKIEDNKPPENFDPKSKTKILIHGYAGSLEFNGTVLVRQGEFRALVVGIPAYLIVFSRIKVRNPPLNPIIETESAVVSTKLYIFHIHKQ